MEGSSFRRYNIASISKFILPIVTLVKFSAAQSIGYHPQFNFGFNPYFSPIFGYGLGLPFGAYNLSPAKNPLLLGSIAATAPLSDKYGFMGKLHAKAFLKKLATNQLINLSSYPIGGGSLKDQLNILKHPEFAVSPYGTGYGYGKHYGAAVLPNNPYKSVYVDYYDSKASNEIATEHKLVPPSKSDNILDHHSQPTIGPSELSSFTLPHHKSYNQYLKPIIKTGAFLTSLALLGKKIFETPIRLNPSGMILHDEQP